MVKLCHLTCLVAVLSRIPGLGAKLVPVKIANFWCPRTVADEKHTATMESKLHGVQCLEGRNGPYAIVLLFIQ